MFWSLDGKIDEMKNEEHQRLDDLEFIVEDLEKDRSMRWVIAIL